VKSEGWRWEQRDDVTLFELLNALWGRRVLVGGIAAAMMIFVTLLVLLWGPAYVARATLSVSDTDEGLGPEVPVSEEANPSAQPGARQSSEALIQRVWGVVDEKELSLETMRRVGYASSLEEFTERLDLEDDYGAGTILVSFSADDAEEARSVADEYAKVLVERTDDLNRQGPVGGTLATEVEVSGKAELLRGRAATSLLYGAAAGFAGLLVGGGVAFALESRTRRWRGARDAELTLRAPVLGVIPDYALEEKVG
jgi:capsular polysaccharide biosynthesis protein